MGPSLAETGNLPKMTVNRAGICGAAVPSKLFDVAINGLGTADGLPGVAGRVLVEVARQQCLPHLAARQHLATFRRMLTASRR